MSVNGKITLTILIIIANTDENSVVLFVNSTGKLYNSYFQVIFK